MRKKKNNRILNFLPVCRQAWFFTFIISICALCFSKANAQNNAIFSGGNEDGFAVICHTQADAGSNDIFKGGNADGFTEYCYTQTDVASLEIFYGGNADGFTEYCFTQSDASPIEIFSGGNADGFSVNCYEQANAASFVFNGGNADGFAVNCVGSVGNEVPLPIELFSFTAECDNNMAQIHWVTASETSNDYFVLEKSADAINWYSIATIDGAGNSNTCINYNHTDANNDFAYYRLKQTDFNGNYTYSSITQADCQNHLIEIINIYPNPASDYFDYIIYSTEAREILVYVTDVFGRVIINKKENIAEGSYYMSLDVSNLTPATYYFNIETLNGLSKDSKQILIK